MTLHYMTLHDMTLQYITVQYIHTYVPKMPARTFHGILEEHLKRIMIQYVDM